MGTCCPCGTPKAMKEPFLRCREGGHLQHRECVVRSYWMNAIPGVGFETSDDSVLQLRFSCITDGCCASSYDAYERSTRRHSRPATLEGHQVVSGDFPESVKDLLLSCFVCEGMFDDPFPLIWPWMCEHAVCNKDICQVSG